MTLEDPISSKVIDEVEEEYRVSTPAKNIDRWVSFLDSFQVTKHEQKSRPYLDQIKSMSSASSTIYQNRTEEASQKKEEQMMQEYEGMGRVIFILNYQDLVHARADMFGTFTSERYKKKEDKERRILNIKVLCYQIRYHWDSAQRSIKHAVWSILNKVDKAYAERLGDPEKIIIVVHNYEITKTIGNISSKDLDKFSRIEALIAQYDDQPSIEVLGVGWTCMKCAESIALPAGRKPPKKCLSCDHADVYTEEPGMRKVRDFMYFIAQDTADKMRVGQTAPNSINVSISEMPFVKSVYNTMEIGSYVALNGIVRLAESSSKTSIKSNAEFECVGIEILHEKNKYDKEIRELVEREIPPELIDEHYEKLKKSYAPHLQGLTVAKEVLLLHGASGGSLKDRLGGTRIRGRMNTLLFGDTGQGKSELFNFHMRLHKRSIPSLGSHSSRVGLTASIKKIETIRGGEKITRQSIDPGPYGMCRGGDVGIDEWDKVANKEIYEAVASAMDNFQVLHLHKNAAHTTIHVDCGSLHVANPTSGSGKYDTSLSIFKQTNFAHWLWSRYDFKILFLGNRTDEARHLLWQHKAKSMENMITENEYNTTTYDQFIKNRSGVDMLEGEVYPFDYLVQELAYVIEQYPDPVFKPGSMAWIMMMQFWNRFNKISIIPETDIMENGEKSAFVPALDERSIDSMIRAGKASARLHRRNEVTTQDVSIVISLMRQTIKAFIPHVDLDAEAEREEQAAAKLINETIRSAMLFNTKELNDQILKFYYALVRVLKAIHQVYFNRCDTCNGKGFIAEKSGYIPSTVEKPLPCTSCHNTKGDYKKLSYAEFEKITVDTSTSVYCNDFFALLKRIGFLVKDDVVTTTVYYRIPKNITDIRSPKMLAIIQKAINAQFGVDEYSIAAQKKILVNKPQN